MRKHNAPLGKWGRALYRAGLKSHRLRRNGTAEELRRLHEACQNAESVPRLEEESRRLFCSVVRGTFFAEDWDVFVRVKKETYLALQRLERDARRYGWKAPDLPFLRYAELPPETLADLPDEMFARIPPELCMDVSAADIPVYPATGSEGVHGG